MVSNAHCSLCLLRAIFSYSLRILPLDFKPFFERHGIRYDFSVIPGALASTTAQRYDFSALTPCPSYRFSEVIDQPKSDGEFIEIPISARPALKNLPLLERVLLKVLWKTGCRSLGDGQGVIPQSTAKHSGATATAVKTLSIEDMNALNLREYDHYLAEHEVVHLISHPKMISRHNLKTFSRFLESARRGYNLNFDFRTMTPG